MTRTYMKEDSSKFKFPVHEVLKGFDNNNQALKKNESIIQQSEPQLKILIEDANDKIENKMKYLNEISRITKTSIQKAKMFSTKTMRLKRTRSGLSQINQLTSNIGNSAQNGIYTQEIRNYKLKKS